ncbi:ClbS/DfsB family four-helix bundle protein [Vagococcus sp. BWB3-3]|uniref:ClbS/DfsB family four-helix bundle protein n=1 Tax=Vagococcus allomyrinae TaxID=2794353 RepID=A0A940PBJ7_9ENTE|nr:ClbS/DfsB family four-helix bundle protein [Vagococcus allomyrinae]MBP1043111.1 ClbS/DfsB family four-helix bundle protein [Vagococcus allomyrinae]
MARPKSKDELLAYSEDKYHTLLNLIASLSPEQQIGSFPFEDRDRNIRDVLVHLHEWQLMMNNWYDLGMKGEKPVMPREGYTWKTTADMNLVIWQDYQETSFQEALTLLAESHQLMLRLIKSHTNEELFTKKVYPWTNTTSLGAYFVSATSSHYDWALKKIRRYQRTLK